MPPPDAVPGSTAAPSPANIARDPANRQPPTATVPSTPTTPPAPPLMPAPNRPSYRSSVPAGEDAVNKLVVYSPDGGKWDFGRHQGSLVLLDFWGSWCGPCRRAIPGLIQLQREYGPQNLEVVGIACEHGAWSDRVGQVRDVRSQMQAQGLNYQFYLDGGEDNRWASVGLFQVKAFPTLILLDGEGRVLWRGGPDRLDELRGTITRQLAAGDVTKR
jgi:thiol-disulfide isomerase/thioredoxin